MNDSHVVAFRFPFGESTRENVVIVSGVRVSLADETSGTLCICCISFCPAARRAFLLSSVALRAASSAALFHTRQRLAHAIQVVPDAPAELVERQAPRGLSVFPEEMDAYADRFGDCEFIDRDSRDFGFV
ncbi:MAG TPA: hypothetical protein VGE10_05405 [Zeimonas sp.]